MLSSSATVITTNEQTEVFASMIFGSFLTALDLLKLKMKCEYALKNSVWKIMGTKVLEVTESVLESTTFRFSEAIPSMVIK